MKMTATEYARHTLHRIFVYVNAAVNAGANVSQHEVNEYFSDLFNVEIVKDTNSRIIQYDLYGGGINQNLLNTIYSQVNCQITDADSDHNGLVDLHILNTPIREFPRLIADWGDLLPKLVSFLEDDDAKQKTTKVE